MTTHSKYILAFTAACVIACTGCQSLSSSTAMGAATTPASEGDKPAARRGPEVEVVRNGVLTGYNSTTVGKAFEGTFQNAKWSSFETPKGATVVQFDGTVSPEGLRVSRSKFYLEGFCIDTLGLQANIANRKEVVSNEQQQHTAAIRNIAEQLKATEEPWIKTMVFRTGNYDQPTNQTPAEPVKETSKQKLERQAKRQELLKEETSVTATYNEKLRALQESGRGDEAKIEHCMQTLPVPVRFQFLLSADKKAFEINYVDEKVFRDKGIGQVMDFIYR